MIVRDGAVTNPAAVGAILPGINVFTQKMRVSPRFSFDFNTALVFGHGCGFNAELGYNFFARQAEKVQLKTAFPTNLAIVGFDADGDIDPTLINRFSNIGDNGFGSPATVDVTCIDPATTTVVPVSSNFPAQGQPGFVAGSTIRPQDLNLLSAAAPAVLTNLVYASVGYNWDDRCYPIFVGLGGSYEFTSNNAGLDRWLVWGKFGVSI